VDLSISRIQESHHSLLHRAYSWRFDFKSQTSYCVFPTDKKSVRDHYITLQRVVKQVQENP